MLELVSLSLVSLSHQYICKKLKYMSFFCACSGDTDTVVPLSATRRSLAALGLPVKTSWYPWYMVSTEVSQVSRTR
jgi:hypothetical protein